MLLHTIPIGPILEETACVVRTAFPKGTLCLCIRDALDTIYEDEVFADLFSHIVEVTRKDYCGTTCLDKKRPILRVNSAVRKSHSA